MRRKLSLLMTAALLFLCLAAGTLWLRSHWASDYAEFVGLDVYAVGHTVPGKVQGRISFNYGLVNYWGSRRNPPRTHAHHSVLPDEGTDWQTLKLDGTTFDWRMGPFLLAPCTGRGMDGRTIRGVYFSFPIWLGCVLTAILPARRVLHLRHRRAPVAPACSACRYDLRATRNRCPECGAVPEFAARTAA